MPHLIDQAARIRPGEIALQDDTHRLTWAELAARVDAWVHVLRAAGLRVGDRVACLAGNRAESIELALAALHSGLTVVPVNWHLTAPEIAYILDDSGSAGLVVDGERSETGARALRQATVDVRLRVVTGSRAEHGFEPLEPLEPLLAGAPAGAPADQTCGAVMMYTSGTTGSPKGVQNNLFTLGAPFETVDRLVRYAVRALKVPSGERVMAVAPWYHSAQFFFAVIPMLAGSTLVLRQRFDPAGLLEDLDGAQIGAVHLVPTHFVRMLRLDEATRARFGGEHLRLVWHGGGPCSVSVKQAMIDWWGPVLLEYYGATEGGAVTMIDSLEWLSHRGSVGRSVPPNEVLILDGEGRPEPSGVAGQVFVRRRNGQSFSYHNAPEKTRAAHHGPGTFSFGELGYLDPDGYLYLTGRAQDMIVSGGVNVYPAEVEAALGTHPAVADSAVIGLPDEEFGERVVAVVEFADRGPDGAGCEPAGEAAEGVAGLARLDPGTARALEEHCRDRIAGYKVPREWFAAGRLPREATGKLRKGPMAELVSGLVATEPAGAPE